MLWKYSASSAAFVFESSPPMMIKPSNSNSLHTFADAANWSSPFILSRPEPIMSKPPMFRYSSMNLSSIFTYFPVNTPRGPYRKPYMFPPTFLQKS